MNLYIENITVCVCVSLTDFIIVVVIARRFQFARARDTNCLARAAERSFFLRLHFGGLVGFGMKCDDDSTEREWKRESIRDIFAVMLKSAWNITCIILALFESVQMKAFCAALLIWRHTRICGQRGMMHFLNNVCMCYSSHNLNHLIIREIISFFVWIISHGFPAPSKACFEWMRFLLHFPSNKLAKVP